MRNRDNKCAQREIKGEVWIPAEAAIRQIEDKGQEQQEIDLRAYPDLVFVDVELEIDGDDPQHRHIQCRKDPFGNREVEYV